jgi:hypothetical protein
MADSQLAPLFSFAKSSSTASAIRRFSPQCVQGCLRKVAKLSA